MAEQKIETEKAFISHPGIRWGSVIGGWLFAYAFAMLLYLLGAAVGLSSLAVINGLSKGVTISTGIWMIFAWVLATYTGAVFAGRFSGVGNRGTGMMHGVLVWALSGLMTLFIGSVQAGMIAKAGINATQGVAQLAGPRQGMEGEAASTFKETFQDEFKSQAGRVIAAGAGSEEEQGKVREAIEKLDAASVSQITAYLTLGDLDKARQKLSAETDLSEQEVRDLVTGLSESAGYYGNQITNRAGAAIEQAGDLTSAALWVLFLSSLLGLGAGAWGGSVGASMAARSYSVEGAEYIHSAFYEHEHHEVPQQRRKAG